MIPCCQRTLFFWMCGRRSCRDLTCEAPESAAMLLPLPLPPLQRPPLPSPRGSFLCNRTSWFACGRCSWSRRATYDRTCRFGLLGTTLRDSTLSRRLVRDQLTRRRRRRRRSAIMRRLTGSGAVTTAAMSTGHLHYLVPPSQRVPVLDASRYGAPPLRVRPLVTHTAVPAALQLLEVAVL